MQSRILFLLALLIGSFSYALFFLGVGGFLNVVSVQILSCVFLILIFVSVAKNLTSALSIFGQIRKNVDKSLLLLAFILINIVGVLGPELSFDALWYHLTIPKLYIESQSINFIPGGLLYYSAMPKLIDIFYIPYLMFGNEMLVKFVHFLFGLLCVVVTFKIANLFVDKKLAYLGAIIYYSNLVVGWLSTSSYIDLGRTFFASVAIYFFILYLKNTNLKYLVLVSIIIGFEIASKLLGVGTLFIVLISLFLFSKVSTISKTIHSLILVVIPLFIVSPWIIFSYLNTKNPVYPFLTDIYPVFIQDNILLSLLKDTTTLFIFSADPISPLYALSIPFVIVFFKKADREMKFLILFCSISLVIWNFIPQKNARFILPYLPLFSVIVVWVVSNLNLTQKRIFYFFMSIVFVINIIYRGVANFKYIPYIIGLESKQDFLLKNLNFEFGDFYDTDSRILKIVNNERVLVKGIHNLYYIDFKYDHESWKEEKDYKYILSRNQEVERGYKLVYRDKMQDVNLYEKN